MAEAKLEAAQQYEINLGHGVKATVVDGGHATPKEEKRYADRIAELQRGRPSLSGSTGVSPRVSVRIPESWEAVLSERAEQEHLSRTEVVRKALGAYLGIAS